MSLRSSIRLQLKRQNLSILTYWDSCSQRQYEEVAHHQFIHIPLPFDLRIAIRPLTHNRQYIKEKNEYLAVRTFFVYNTKHIHIYIHVNVGIIRTICHRIRTECQRHIYEWNRQLAESSCCSVVHPVENENKSNSNIRVVTFGFRICTLIELAWYQ